jgi:hypothetical protein
VRDSHEMCYEDRKAEEVSVTKAGPISRDLPSPKQYTGERGER